MLSRLKFEIAPLVEEILDRIPEEQWTSKVSTFFDPAIGGGQFVSAIEARLRKYGHSDKNISGRVFGCEIHKRSAKYAIRKYGLVGTYYACNFLEEEWNMHFDNIVGNPPYQDGTNNGGNSKLYNLISKKALSLLNPNGRLSFITPTSVLKDSRQFTLHNEFGLKTVDFSANSHFNVGVNICAWTIDLSYNDDVHVIDSNKITRFQPLNEPIYDYASVDKKFVKLYHTLKNVADSFENRMFKRSSRGIDDSPTKTSIYNHPYYKINKNREIEISYYMKNHSIHLHKKKKFIVSRTKSFNETGVVISTLDFDCNHMVTSIDNDEEIDNIKSFIFSDYFINHSNAWKKLEGNGFNSALTYLPPFDKTKSWTNDEVKEFLESYVK